MHRVLCKSAVAARRRLGHRGLMLMAITMIGVGMATPKDYHGDTKSVLLPCFTTLVASALSLANADYVSVYVRYDIMKFQEKREMRMGLGERNWLVPSPSVVAACAAVNSHGHGQILARNWPGSNSGSAY
ncbi:hypothetical protein NL676_013155 [Syzygium grande]|nr:hypothetical protein NL676_013155 [Syzygium grande]